MKNQRTGATGALLDEYERMLAELKQCISSLSESDFAKPIQPDSQVKSFVSIGSVLEHVLRCGYLYATLIKRDKAKDESIPYPTFESPKTAQEFYAALDAMFAYNIEVLATVDDNELLQFDPAKKMQAYWGQLFDYEQVIEHGIVHIMRHRRQIEKFKTMLS